jgi:eukaryotic-like serine/threonine-protein kinase
MTQTVVCPACRKENSARARFCQHCGHDVILNNAGPQYFLTRVIKEGGQGAVYEGRDEAGKIYAVKEMLDNFSDPQERTLAVARFNAEAATLGRLSDPRIPRIYASFNDEGRHYLVMDFIRGEDLDDIVTREGPLPEARVLAWADELCDVLEYLHGRGVIYRDMKPSNVMLEQPAGTLKLIDFGIAKVFQAQTRGTQIGTPGYAPPEQYQGLATRSSDIYALGATLHHLLSGRDPQLHAPFTFPSLRALAPAVSPRTEAAVARALQMREEDRFQSVAELRAALRPAPPAQVIAAKPAPVAAPAAALPPTPTPSAPAATPATAPAPPAPKPVPAPAPPATKPAPTPAAPTSAAPPTAPMAAPSPPPTRRRRRWPGCLLAMLLLLLGLGAAGLVLVRPDLLPTPTPAPSATPQNLVERSFSFTLEVGVPAGSDEATINQAFVNAFLATASSQCACQPQIVTGTVIFDAAPRQVSTDGRTDRYQATIEATLRVPE